MKSSIKLIRFLSNPSKPCRCPALIYCETIWRAMYKELVSANLIVHCLIGSTSTLQFHSCIIPIIADDDAKRDDVDYVSDVSNVSGGSLGDVFLDGDVFAVSVCLSWSWLLS